MSPIPYQIKSAQIPASLIRKKECSLSQGVCVALVFSGVLFSASAAADFIPTLPLGQAGQTDLQQRTGDAIMTTCLSFVDNGIDQAAANAADQTLLLDKCTELVSTSLEVTGAGTVLNAGLGISADQLASALQQMTNEEIAAAGSLATESAANQASLVGRRLASILARSSDLQVGSANMIGHAALVAAVDARSDGPERLPQGGAAAAGDGSLLGQQLSVYVNGMVGTGEKDATAGEDGYESDSAGIAVGADFRVGSNFVFGGMIGFSSSESDFEIDRNVSGGSLSADLASFSAYGLYFDESKYFDAVLTVGTGSYDMERNILVPSADGLVDDNGSPNDGFNGRAVADTDSDQVRFSVGGGLELVSGSLTFAPYGRISVLDVEMDGYTESGASGLNLRVEDQSVESVTTGLGYRVVSTYSTSKAVLSPQISFEWVHEYSDDRRQIVSTFANDPRSSTPGHQLIVETDSPDRNYYVLGFGVSSVMPNGLQLFGDVKTLLDLDDINDTVLTAGLRYEF